MLTSIYFDIDIVSYFKSSEIVFDPDSSFVPEGLSEHFSGAAS